MILWYGIVLKELGLSEKDARAHISKLEGEHRRLVKNYFQTDIREATHYHLVVNTALITPEAPEAIVAIVKTALAAQR